MNTMIRVSKIKATAAKKKYKHDLVLYQMLKDSIQEHGILNPLTVAGPDENGQYELVNGLERYTVAKDLGLFEVPCQVVSSVSEQEIVMYREL